MADQQGDIGLICDILFNPQYSITSTQYAGAVLLTSVLQDNPKKYKRYIQQRGDNFLDIMNSEEESSKEAAYNACGPIEENIDSDVVISGRSAVAVAVEVAVGSQDPQAVIATIEQSTAAYTRLMTFVSNVRGEIQAISTLMFDLVRQIQENVINVLPIAHLTVQRTYVYDNIELVYRSFTTNPQEIFPKFSINIVCQKEPLLQTVLVAGRENGMGKILNDFVFKQLQQYPVFLNYATLKVVEPSESNRLWQVKISIHENDFVFFTIQVINVKEPFYLQEQGRFTVLPNIDSRMTQPLFYLYENLCFSLYNKANSKDFNCFCGLSELDIYILRQIIVNQEHFRSFLQCAFNFLTNLVDAQVNLKKKYFILGLYNLIYCLRQSNYTIETKVYRWLFDRPDPALNVMLPLPNNNVFLHAMRIIQYVNTLCGQADYEGEKTRLVMGGGKQYSLFQKALNKFFLTNVGPGQLSEFMMTTFIQTIFPTNSDPVQDAPLEELRQRLFREMIHAFVKAAADADFGFFHRIGVIGSVECMSVCMILQIALKKLVDFKLTDSGNSVPYSIDIGNSCIGNPPTTLSSLRMVLTNSISFYQNLEGVQGIDGLGILINNILTHALRIDLNGIESVISPFDLVPKGSAEDYIFHIIEAVLLFGNIRTEKNDFYNRICRTLSNYCFITVEGFSSPLKGIFDILYTLFIIENFTNRTLVTQKINKELKRISICAQILYLHYNELRRSLHDLAASQARATATANDAAAIDAAVAGVAGIGDATINPMLDILKDMILYGYDGSNLLHENRFDTIMRKYVEFITKIVHFNGNEAGLGPFLNFYCVDPTPMNIGREMTTTEIFFMNLLENSNHEPRMPAAVDGERRIGHPAVPLLDMSDYNPEQRQNFDTILGCIIPSITAIIGMNQELLQQLYQNKIYSSYRDTQNKRNSIVVISTAYQLFLWRTRNRPLILFQDPSPEDEGIFRQSIGLSQLLSTTPTFFEPFIRCIEPCCTHALNSLDLLDDEIDGIGINNPIKFQFVFWFITCIFGIKTKSSPKKIVSIARAYLNNIRNMLGPGQNSTLLFECTVTFPDVPNPHPALIEDGGVAAAAPHVNPVYNPNDVLLLAYDPYTIDKAYYRYANAEENYGNNPVNIVFKNQNSIVISINSQVLKKDVIPRLILAFSKLPRGQAYLNQSYAFMTAVMNQLIQSLDRNQSLIDNLDRVLHIPGILTDIPYKPTAHDVSKFIDYRTNPQAYRNKWINYLFAEILYSGNDGENLFSHMKLLVLLIKYLTLLPVRIGLEQIHIMPGSVPTTQNAMQIAQQLILRSYICTPITVERAAQREHLAPQTIVQDIHGARVKTQRKNLDVATAVAAAATAAAAAAAAAPVAVPRRRGAQPQPLPVAHAPPAPPAPAVRRRRGAEPPQQPPVAPAPTPTPPKKKQRGGTISFRPPHSPKKTNNHTRKNKYKRNNKNKKHKSSPRYRKVNPSSRSGSQSNRKKSKSKLQHKNVTFKRRRARK
jgi:hypothetical protein